MKRSLPVSAQELPITRKEWSSKLVSTSSFNEITSKKNFKIPEWPNGARHEAGLELASQSVDTYISLLTISATIRDDLSRLDQVLWVTGPQFVQRI